MTIELTILVLCCCLGLVQIAVAAHAANLQRGYGWAGGSRDTQPLPVTGIAGRLQRASANFQETFPFFAAAILIAHIAGVQSWMTEWGAYLYFVGRLIFVFLYASGVALIRSFFWGVALVGIVLVLLAPFV